jgi:transposase
MVLDVRSWSDVGQEDWRLIDVEDWAEIRRLHKAEDLGIKTSARRLGVARNTVRAALRSDVPPKYERTPRGSIVDVVEPEIRKLLKDVPDMPATVIAERIGWSRGMTVLRDRIGELRPLFAPVDPSQRTWYRPGELAQWDLWQPDVLIPLGFGQSAKLWTVVGVSGFSRLIGALMVPTRAAHDVLAGMLEVIGGFGAVPRKAVWDQEGCIGRIRQKKQILTAEFQAFRGVLGMGAVLVGPNDPEAKGLVERANGYLETSFLPGRSFEDIDDFNRQLGVWLKRANQRIHGTTRVRPSEAILEDRGAMMAFPPVLPDPSWRFSIRLPRDHYVRVDTNDYSVNPRYVGRRVDVQVTLNEMVVVCEGVEVARHKRCLAKHQTLLTGEHARILRQIRAEAAEPKPVEVTVEERDLAVYDQLYEAAS